MIAPGYKIVYHRAVVKEDIPKLDRVIKIRIKSVIEKKLTAAPEIYGVPLRGTLKHYWKLRAGDWRIVYEVKSKQVRILFISHRNKIYEIAQKIIEARK